MNRKGGPVNPGGGGEGEGTAAEGQGVKSGQISAAACGVGGEKKKLYVFFVHYGPRYSHSFHEVRIPNPNEGAADELEVTEKLHPILAFNLIEDGVNICCAYLDSKFYFIGGASFLRGPDPVYHKEVRILDMSTMPKPSERPEENLGCLKPGPEMKCPKHEPVAFVAQGQIFVLSGLRYLPGIEDRIIPFEKFTPDADGGGQWKELATPPFTGDVTAHVVIKNRLYVLSWCKPSIFIYDLNSNSWDQITEPPPPPPPTFGFLFGSLVLDDTKIYTCAPRSFLVSRTIDASATATGNSKLPKCLEFEAIPVMGNSFTGHRYPSTYLVGGVRDYGQFCYLQVGCPFNPSPVWDDTYKECVVKVTLIDSSNDKVLGRAAFSFNPFRAPTRVVAAFAV